MTAEMTYELTLFVNGASDLSARAITNARALCETHLRGRYELSVVDVREAAVDFGGELLATPTLVKHRPTPERRLVGALSDPGRVLATLGLP
jgi:circadian clock protein KaiB